MAMGLWKGERWLCLDFASFVLCTSEVFTLRIFDQLRTLKFSLTSGLFRAGMLFLEKMELGNLQ